MPTAQTKTTRNAGNAAQAATSATINGAEKIAASAAKDMSDAAFAYPKFEVPEMFRSFAEQGLTQSRDAYGRMKAATEEATDVLEDSFESTRASLRDVQFKALDAAKINADATFELARKLLTVTSLSDAFQLQAAFARERFEALVDYSKDVQGTLGRVSAEAAKPAKVMMDRALSQSKAA